MAIPDVFYDFCLYLHQDSMEVYGPDVQDVIDGALQHIPVEQRLLLRNYLSELLSGQYSDNQLQEIFHSTDAELGIRRGLRQFLAQIRDTINSGIGK